MVWKRFFAFEKHSCNSQLSRFWIKQWSIFCNLGSWSSKTRNRLSVLTATKATKNQFYIDHFFKSIETPGSTKKFPFKITISLINWKWSWNLWISWKHRHAKRIQWRKNKRQKKFKAAQSNQSWNEHRWISNAYMDQLLLTMFSINLFLSWKRNHANW